MTPLLARCTVATTGDDEGAERGTSASAEAADDVGTFFPHLSLLGAVQSRQLGEFLDGKGEPLQRTSVGRQAVS